MIPAGTYRLHQTSLDRGGPITINLDFRLRDEIVAGATLISCTCRVMLNNAASSAITLDSATCAINDTLASVDITDVSAVADSTYHLIFDAVLSDGTHLDPEAVLLPVELV